MTLKLMGKKRGMIKMYDDKGRLIPCTVIEIEPNIVTQVKTKETDGYNAIQLGFEKIQVKDERTMDKRVKKPLRGHFKKAGVDPRRYLTESRLENSGDYTIGQEIDVAVFSEVTFVDATATSKGKGYQGVMKLHNMAGGPASHGSGFHRHHGSTGMRSTPGRVLPGGKAASQMGNRIVTIQNLRVIMIVQEDNLLIVEGQVPGARNGLVYVQKAKKKVAA